MKLFLISIIVFCLFSLAAGAQSWTPSSPNIYFTGGNVGIGTTTPGVPLDVLLSNTTIYTPSSTTVNSPLYVFRNSNQSNTAGISALQSFSALDGLGVNNLWYMGLASTASNFGGVFVIGNRSGSTSYAERFRIDGQGNVGIGISNPASKLVVAPTYGNSVVDQSIAVISSAGQNSFGGYVGQRVINGNTRQGLVVSGTGSLTLNAQAYNMDFITGTISPADDTNLRMRILANGNVGIGTASPDQKLTVNGTVHAKLVVVDLSIVPDYVFKPAYKLPSLGYVKNYVEKNSHLPDVPSEAEIKKNGLDVGEMNAVLLKKVEELTLYMIEKDKQVQEQREINKQLKAQLTAQQNQINKIIKTQKNK